MQVGYTGLVISSVPVVLSNCALTCPSGPSIGEEDTPCPPCDRNPRWSGPSCWRVVHISRTGLTPCSGGGRCAADSGSAPQSSGRSCARKVMGAQPKR